MKFTVAACSLFLLVWNPVRSYSQERMDIDDSFVLELGLPNSFVNGAFKNIMQGLVYVSPMYQYTLKSGLSFGAGVHYS
ncbi:MAG: hypothetical protein EB023_14110, partial [Flavobacteriia bacterium]|nr:hypothetical protein [Flavobacteriia bacterium]